MKKMICLLLLVFSISLMAQEGADLTEVQKAYEEAIALYGESNFADALAKAEEATAVDWDKLSEIYFLAGNCAYKLANYEKALTHFSSALSAGYDKNAILNEFYKIGVGYKKAQYVNEALSTFQKIVKIEPNHSKANLQIARLYKKLGDFEELIKISDKLIEIGKEWNAYYYRGDAYSGLEKYEESINAYEKAKTYFKENDKNYIIILNKILKIYIQLEDDKNIIAVGVPLLNVAKKDNTKKSTAIKIANAYKNLGNNQKAVEYFDIYASFLQGNKLIQAYYIIYDIYIESDIEMANQYADKALKVLSNDMSNFMKGNVLYKNKKYKESKNYFSKISTSFEYYSTVQSALKWMKENGF